MSPYWRAVVGRLATTLCAAVTPISLAQGWGQNLFTRSVVFHWMGDLAVKNSASGTGSVFEWPDVLRAVPGSKTRSWLIQQYKDSGFNADSFATRKGREAMANALTATEDWLEIRGTIGARARSRVRDLRRRLELELWP